LRHSKNCLESLKPKLFSNWPRFKKKSRGSENPLFLVFFFYNSQFQFFIPVTQRVFRKSLRQICCMQQCRWTVRRRVCWQK
jgi:hypothetical protein